MEAINWDFCEVWSSDIGFSLTTKALTEQLLEEMWWDVIDHNIKPIVLNNLIYYPGYYWKDYQRWLWFNGLAIWGTPFMLLFWPTFGFFSEIGYYPCKHVFDFLFLFAFHTLYSNFLITYSMFELEWFFEYLVEFFQHDLGYGYFCIVSEYGYKYRLFVTPPIWETFGSSEISYLLNIFKLSIYLCEI
jgi:hypothetical protein